MTNPDAVREALMTLVQAYGVSMHEMGHGPTSDAALCAVADAIRDALLSRPEGTGEAVRHDCEEWHNEGIGCTHCHAVLYPPAPAVSEAHPDTKRLDWLEAQAIKLHDYQIGWAQAGHESGEYGEYLSEWDGGFYVIGCDVDGLYDHTSLRNAIDAALAAQGA